MWSLLFSENFIECENYGNGLLYWFIIDWIIVVFRCDWLFNCVDGIV